MNLRTVLWALILCLFLHRSAVADTYSKLEELYSQKRYFELRDALAEVNNSRSVELLYYRGAVCNKFNQPEKSIQYLLDYLKQAADLKDVARLRECYGLLSDNYTKTFQYRKAAEADKTILTKYKSGLEAQDASDFENIYALRHALSEVPRQKVSFDGDSRIQTARDALGLVNLPVETNNQKVVLGFDTGAAFSVVTDSYAAKLGLKIIETRVDISSITGDKVKARLGFAPRIKIGNITLQNVVFLVFADKDLYIAPLHFQLNGLVGFPVIAALREITFLHGGDALVPAHAGKGVEQNLCLDGLKPLIEGTYKGRRLTFCFDTGANTTYLYPPFFKAYEEEIKTRSASRLEKIQGAGGYKEILAYEPKNLAMTFAGKEAHFSRVTVLTETTLDSSRYFYGNIGRDLIDQFHSMTLNFASMSIDFQ